MPPHEARGRSPVGSGWRIGIDGTCLALGRGYGRVLREMLPVLVAGDARHQFVLFLDEETAAQPVVAELVASLPRDRVDVLRLHTSRSQAAAASATGSRSPLDLIRMGRVVSRTPLDVLWFPSVFSWFPVPGPTPQVVGFMDTIAERHARMVFPSWHTRLAWQAKSWLARRRADAVLTASEFSKRCLHELLRVPLARIHVMGHAPAPVFAPVDDLAPGRAWLSRHGLPEDAPYWIYVGGVNPHKNMPALVRAFARAPVLPDGRRPWLLLVGDFTGDTFHSDVDALRAEITRAGVAGRVLLPGFVSDTDLRPLYAGAIACVLVSLEEGFGLPAVEAAACGTPCVATTRSPLPQVLEGGGLFVDPEDEAAIADALARLSCDTALRQRCAETARQRAAALSWEAAADATRAVLLACAARGRA